MDDCGTVLTPAFATERHRTWSALCCKKVLCALTRTNGVVPCGAEVDGCRALGEGARGEGEEGSELEHCR